MYNFCTLFDSNYLTRGLAMYESLKENCKNFHLYVFPFDDNAYFILEKLNLSNVTLVTLLEFEDPEILSVKSSRTKGEYCWTATSSIIFYCINTFNLSHCVYVDADIYFFDDPAILLKEVEDKSILLTDHRYSKQYDRAYDCGKYCVQFIYFRNDANGMNALGWWRKECLNWCYNRQENNKFGDQKYLDDWTIRFNNVVVLEHLGGGLAPWNIQQYELDIRGDKKYVKRDSLDKPYPIVFYHFHELKFISGQTIVRICEYVIPKLVKKKIYKPYIIHLTNIKRKLDSLFPEIQNQERVMKGFFMRLKLFIYHVIKRDKNLFYIFYGRIY